MSRLIVRNLPNKITEKKILDIFSKVGNVTDVKLKYTEDGKFRHFGFVGFQTEEQAHAAQEKFDRTFINAVQIQVEPCLTLSEQKAAVRGNSAGTQPLELPKPEKEKMKKKDKIKDSKVAELISSHKDDNLFREYMEVHLPNQSDLWRSDEKVDKNDDEDNCKKDADKNISDLDYIKKKKVKDDNKDKKVEETNKVLRPYTNRFTVKVSNLPYKVKKGELKEFFAPLRIASMRLPVKVKGIAYCDFETETVRKRALANNRGFIRSNRIFVKQFDKKSKVPDKWKEEEAKMKDVESIAESGRIFVRNLAFSVLPNELKELFEVYGPVTEVIIPIDPLSRNPKGFGFITFLIPENACQAYNKLDGTIFQGRMLHLLPGRPKEGTEEDDDTGLSFKEKKAKKQRSMATNKINWNTFFINENCLAEAMAQTYNTTKETVLSDEKGGAAVRLALGETEMVQKTKNFLVENGVLLEAFENMTDSARSDTVILIKNLPFSTEVDEIRNKFVGFGELSSVLLSPFGGTAIVEFIEPFEAMKAFKGLAYKKFKHTPLYLEWGPKNIFDGRQKAAVKEDEKKRENDEHKEEQKDPKHVPVDGSILYVKGINFSTNADTLRQHFETCGNVASAIVAEKRDPNNPGKKLSMGYGFVEFADVDSADKALKSLQFSSLEGHTIELKRSNRTTAANDSSKATAKKGKPSTKIMVRNVPFQATERELRSLFEVFGIIKSLRLPKKMVGTGTHRGFCFVEYQSIHDAKRAFKALSESTHLYGRRLVLEWAESDDDVETLRKKVAQTFVDGDKGVKRKKISADDVAGLEETDD